MSEDSTKASPVKLLVQSWAPGPDVREQSIFSMLQTREGYLWLGTERGLSRFDGVAFTSFSSANTPGILGDDMNFAALWEDERGVLWAGTDSHGLIRNDHGRFSTFQKGQGLAGNQVLRIDGDETGAVWIFTDGGVSRWADGKLAEIHPERDVEPDRSSVLVAPRSKSEVIHIGLMRRTGRSLDRFAYGHWHPFPMPLDWKGTRNPGFHGVYEDQRHRVWYSIESHPGRYFCAEGNALRIFDGLPESAAVSFQDRDGFLWLTDGTRLAARWKAGRLYPLPEFKATFPLHVIERADGSYWVGTIHTKLYRFRPALIATIETASALDIGSNIFRQRSGEIWAGGSDLRHFEGGQLRPFRAYSPWRTVNLIRVLGEDKDGHLLLGDRRYGGVMRLDGNHLSRFLSAEQIPGEVMSMLLGADNNLWIGAATGLYRISADGGTLTKVQPALDVSCLLELGQGQLLAGTGDGPLVFKDGQWHPLPAVSGWTYGEVLALNFDRTGTLWIGTNTSGLIGYRGGRYHALDTSYGLPSENIMSIYAEDENDLWLKSDVGLIRIGFKALQRRMSEMDQDNAQGNAQDDVQGIAQASDLPATLFGKEAGLPAPQMSPSGNLGSLRLHDGTLWFSTSGGIAAFRPESLVRRRSTPHALIEEHVIDRSGSLIGPIVLRPDQDNLEIHYTALGSDLPDQLRFRYRLNGVDKDWTLAHARRIAYYSHLPPGDYTFEVESADGDGENWEMPSASVTVRVLAPIYKEWWVRPLVLLILIVGLFLIWRARRRVELERYRMRQAFTHRLISTQEIERKRIAHELHDGLGQHLVLIRTLAMLPKQHSSPLPKDPLAQIAEQAAVAIREVETISYDLRPYQLDRLGLTKAVRALVRTLEDGGSIVIRSSIADIDGFFSKDLEINFYRIVQEALSNVLKHAEATEAEITLTRSEQSMRLVIQDNGRGFSESSNRPDSLGLVGIHERSEALGGRATIESNASKERGGTCVTVEITRSVVRSEPK